MCTSLEPNSSWFNIDSILTLFIIVIGVYAVYLDIFITLSQNSIDFLGKWFQNSAKNLSKYSFSSWVVGFGKALIWAIASFPANFFFAFCNWALNTWYENSLSWIALVLFVISVFL